MRVFQAIIGVTAQGEIPPLPVANLPPGQYKAVIVIEEALAQEADQTDKQWVELRPISPSNPPKGSTPSR